MSTKREEYPGPGVPGVIQYEGGLNWDEFGDIIDAIKFPRGQNVLLPTCPGPKLGPFRPHGTVDKIEWLREVAMTEMSAVWKVKIDGKVYCLKLFGFPTALWPLRFQTDKQTLKQQFNHEDSFHCECRAYGRLKETNLEHLVVPCYGYVLLTPAQEEYWRNNSSYPPPDCLIRRPEFFDTPIRCLVKEWVEEGTENFNPSMIRQMKKDIDTMHSVGVINHDIKADNYLGGKLVDFGIAVTVPHYNIDQCKEVIALGKDETGGYQWELDVYRDIDGDRFDTMIEDWNQYGGYPLIWERYFPNPRYSNLRTRQLASRDKITKVPNPLDYDWKRKGGARRIKVIGAGRVNKSRKDSSRAPTQSRRRARSKEQPTKTEKEEY